MKKNHTELNIALSRSKERNQASQLFRSCLDVLFRVHN